MSPHARGLRRGLLLAAALLAIGVAAFAALRVGRSADSQSATATAQAPTTLGGPFRLVDTRGETVTDAVVVLTGGSLRVQSGLALLAAGKARKLFISGVYHSTVVTALLRTSRQSSEHVACCIVLGHEADNTYGNALETAQWMRQEGFHSLRLVTASYHMPRSLLEFSRVMPEIRIIAHPVFPENVKQDRWWAWPGTASLIVAEYDKYLAALVRPLVEDRGSV